MIREILFRGKRVDNGEWVEGYYNYINNKTKILPTAVGAYDGYALFDILSETVGQYTGLTDRLGKKIFEGDILKFKRKKLENVAVGYGKSGYICKVKTSKNTTTFFNLQHFLEKYNCEIIGNIHDNPELMEDKT